MVVRITEQFLTCVDRRLCRRWYCPCCTPARAAPQFRCADCRSLDKDFGVHCHCAADRDGACLLTYGRDVLGLPPRASREDGPLLSQGSAGFFRAAQFFAWG